MSDELTPEEAMEKLNDAFATAYQNQYRVIHSGVGADLASFSSTGYLAATAILRQERPKVKFDFEMRDEHHRLHDIIHRQTVRNR